LHYKLYLLALFVDVLMAFVWKPSEREKFSFTIYRDARECCFLLSRASENKHTQTCLFDMKTFSSFYSAVPKLKKSVTRKVNPFDKNLSASPDYKKRAN